MAWYFDMSAAMELLVTEAESDALADAIDGEQPDSVACCLLETEIRRGILRYDGRARSALDDSFDP